MDSMCIYPTVSTEQMSMIFFYLLICWFYFCLVGSELLFCFFVCFCFFVVVGLLFFYRRPISQRWNSDNQDTKERMEDTRHIGAFWLSKQDLKKERKKVCTTCRCTLEKS